MNKLKFQKKISVLIYNSLTCLVNKICFVLLIVFVIELSNSSIALIFVSPYSLDSHLKTADSAIVCPTVGISS